MLDKLAEKIETNRSLGKSNLREKCKIELAIRAGMRRRTFEVGNGEKILKRLVNLGRPLHADINDDVFYSLLCDWPALRQTVLNWWQNRVAPETKLPLIVDLFSKGTLVDDAAKMDIAVAIVSARLEKCKFVNDHIAAILKYLDHTSSWGLYSKLWLLSKYGSDAEVMSLIESTVSLWVTQEHLSRLVARLYPRFVGSPLRVKFEAIIRRAGNAWSASVLQFHNELSSGTVGYTAIKAFVFAKNTSLPNTISHAKFLMLLSLLHNPDIAPTAVANLKTVHNWALTDEYYAHIAP